MNHQNALIIFMKAPYPGRVKTRLQPQLTPAQSLQIYQAMGKDLVLQLQPGQSYDLYIYFWPPDALREMQQWLGNDLNYIVQHGNNLGEKMHRAFRETLEKGYQKVVIIGSDLPILTSRNIQEALTRLDTHDAVLGPSTDGGYYLIALKQSHERLFNAVQWSQETVLQQTLKNAEQDGLQVALLDTGTDIDSYQEVLQLWQLLRTPNAARTHVRALHTREVLAQILGTFE